jgi:hypothetical protein
MQYRDSQMLVAPVFLRCKIGGGSIKCLEVLPSATRSRRNAACAPMRVLLQKERQRPVFQG